MESGLYWACPLVNFGLESGELFNTFKMILDQPSHYLDWNQVGSTTNFWLKSGQLDVFIVLAEKDVANCNAPSDQTNSCSNKQALFYIEDVIIHYHVHV